MNSVNSPITNRSDLLRQRRSQSDQSRTSRSGQAARKPVKSQPVMVRNVAVVPTRRISARSQAASRSQAGVRATSRPRRQFYYAVGASGAELRLPALPVVRPGWRLVSAGMVILFSFLLMLLLSDPRFMVSSIDVVGLQRMDAAEIEGALDLTNLSIVMVRPEEVAAELQEAFPDLKDIKVSVTFPASVGITLTERTPVIAWDEGDEIYWIDSEGYVIPMRGQPAETPVMIKANTYPPLLPLPKTDAQVETEKAGKSTKYSEIPTGTIFGRQVDLSLLEGAKQLSPFVPPDSVLAYNRESGLGWTDPRGWQVFIGQTIDNIDQKLVVYQALVEKLGQQGITPRMISVEYLHAPFYRMEL